MISKPLGKMTFRISRHSDEDPSSRMAPRRAAIDEGSSGTRRVQGGFVGAEVAGEQAAWIAGVPDGLEPAPGVVAHEPVLADGEVAVAEVLPGGHRLKLGHPLGQPP